ncbi:MAG TPA: isoprenylcysteine carboxylmethyltransferase family protein [Vicinamibacterales bacterium]
MTLNAQAWTALVVLALAMALVLFVPAGSVRYWQAWIYLAVFLAASGLTTLDLMTRDPALLERRMRGGPTAERERTQQIVMLFASLSFVALLVVPALDYRYGWTTVPVFLVVIGNVLVAVGFYLIVLVYRENTFTAATIQVTAGQTVVSTGPYAVVRHPMYASAFVYLIGTPLALGSYAGFIPLAVMMVCIVVRLLDEERLLSRDLPGYDEYRSRVRYRLLPNVW